MQELDILNGKSSNSRADNKSGNILNKQYKKIQNNNGVRNLHRNHEICQACDVSSKIQSFVTPGPPIHRVRTQYNSIYSKMKHKISRAFVIYGFDTMFRCISSHLLIMICCILISVGPSPRSFDANNFSVSW